MTAAGGTWKSSPGGADPGAVALALEELAPLGARVTRAGQLGPLTTYRVGGAAAIMVTVASEDHLKHVARAIAVSGLPVLVVGRGSNLLVADDGFGGVAVLLEPEAFGRATIDRDTLDRASVEAGAAVALPVLARQTVEAGLTGLEWAVGVPGSVGGAVRMNAGGHGSDMSHTMTSCQVVDLSTGGQQAETWPVHRLAYQYRRSSIGPAHVVTAARFELAEGDPRSGMETIREIVRWRREHQPGGQNAGSVFTNPPGDSAGRVIESAGLKGRRWRSAMVSPKHANFIQADPGGSADDVRALIELVGDAVLSSCGISLQTEVKMVGYQPLVEGDS